jgi:hypothetical protein
VEPRTRIELPPVVTRPVEVYVNGVLQQEGADYDLVGTSLVFNRTLVSEGDLGFWRWARMALGIAGTYRKNDTVAVAYTRDGRSRVVTLAPPAPPPEGGSEEDGGKVRS